MSQPAHKIRIGALQVTIWRNPRRERQLVQRHSQPRLQERRRPGRRPTASASTTCSPMAKLLDLAHTWIMHQQRKADAHKARKESAQAAA